MATHGSTRLSEADTSQGSQFNDDDIINKQLQADLNSQAQSHQTNSSKRAKKRKSRDVNESFDSDADGSPKKMRKEKNNAERKEKLASQSLQENVLNRNHDSSSEGANSLSNLTNTKPTEMSTPHFTESRSTESIRDGNRKEAGEKNRRDSSLAGVSGRISLGSNREALLQSILKGCSSEKLSDSKIEHASPSESEGVNAPTTTDVSTTLKISSKPRPRRRVSMVPILPKGYKPDLSGPKSRFYCPIEGCDKFYTRKSTLGEHMNTLHRGQKLRDNKDGTMSIITMEDYKLAISSGDDQDIVEIPDTPLPSNPKRTVKHGSKGKEDTLSATEVLLEGSVGLSGPDKGGLGKSNPAKMKHGSSKSKKLPAGGKQTASNTSHSEKNFSEDETSGDDDSSVNDDRSRPSGHSSIKSPKSKRVKQTKSVKTPVEAPTTTLHKSSQSTHPRSTNTNRIEDESSEDEMEDWEIEPGVIAGSTPNSDDDSETEHNTAYSSVYTTSAEAGIKFSGVHFQVIRVAPGSIAPGPDVPYLRICSVAAGKVQVQVGDKQFAIGAHGMWRIRAGEKCTLANRHYSEAVVHVSTINAD